MSNSQVLERPELLNSGINTEEALIQSLDWASPAPITGAPAGEALVHTGAHSIHNETVPDGVSVNDWLSESGVADITAHADPVTPQPETPVSASTKRHNELNKRIWDLEAKQKSTNGITPQEEHELESLKDQWTIVIPERVADGSINEPLENTISLRRFTGVHHMADTDVYSDTSAPDYTPAPAVARNAGFEAHRAHQNVNSFRARNSPLMEDETETEFAPITLGADEPVIPTLTDTPAVNTHIATASAIREKLSTQNWKHRLSRWGSRIIDFASGHGEPVTPSMHAGNLQENQNTHPGRTTPAATGSVQIV